MIKNFWPGSKKHNTINKIHDFTTDTDKANALNSHFSTVGSKLADKIVTGPNHENYLGSYAPIFDLKPVTVVTIAEAIRNLRPSTSCGVDGLTSRLLKQAGPSIYKPLLHVVNLSIE